jgi:hypothetical protein
MVALPGHLPYIHIMPDLAEILPSAAKEVMVAIMPIK